MFNLKKTIAGVTAAAMTLSLAACGGNKTDDGGTKTITWYIPALVNGVDKQTVFDKANEMLAEKYNLKLDVIGIDSGNFDQKLQVMNAGQEVYDLAFTANWKNNYFNNVSNGVFWDVSEKIQEIAPNTYAQMDESVWDAIKVDGGIYAVPNWQVQAKSTCLFIPKDLLDSTGVSFDSINKFEDMEAYLTELQKIKPEANKPQGSWTWLSYCYGMTELYEEKMPGVIYANAEGKPVVINQYESEEFVSYVKLMNDWVKKGLLTDKYLVDSKAMEKEIMERPFYIQVYKPGGVAEASRANGYDFYGKSISDPILTTNGITAAMTGISATSEHPEDALKMIEVMNTDSEIFNLICWGEEGKHYEKTSDTQIKPVENSDYSGIANWRLGSVMNSYLLDTQEPGVWEETKEFNDTAKLSPILGLNVNVDGFSTELANCKTVINEYYDMIDLGLKDEAGLKEFQNALKTAGVDKIIENLQAQVDEWWAAK